MPDANGAPMTTETPLEMQSGSSSSRASWFNSVYGIAIRKKSISNRSRNFRIMPRRFTPAPIAVISPDALSAASASKPRPSASSRKRASTPSRVF